MEDVIVVDTGPRASDFMMAALAVAFAAFVIWLTVRIVNRKERRTKRTAVILVALLVGYPLSWGPALWLHYRGHLPESLSPAISAFYWPLERLSSSGPKQLRGVLSAYARIWFD